jgi:hypothetical protein
VPGSRDEFYGLTDRGPNVDGPNGTKVEPLPSFDPAIARVRSVGSDAVVEKVIPLRAADGTPYNGRVNTQASTGETITDLDGTMLAPDVNGYDSDGLVAVRDGTFWVSDEYGPFITRFDAQAGRSSDCPRSTDRCRPSNAANGALPLQGRTVEGLVGKQDTSARSSPGSTRPVASSATTRSRAWRPPTAGGRWSSATTATSVSPAWSPPRRRSS